MSDADTLDEILNRRYSCRAFRPDPVPDPVIDRILTMSQRTASWCNSQAWHVHLVTGEQVPAFGESLTRWVASHQQHADFDPPARYDGVYGQRRRASGHGLYAALGIERDDMEARTEQMLRNFRFFDAPHVAVVTSDAGLGTYGAVDCGGYVSTFLAAATALGVATCAQAALALYSDGVRDFLQLAPDRLVVCGIAFGYADHSHPANSYRTDRAALADAVTRIG